MQNEKNKPCITGQCKIGIDDWLADCFQAILLSPFKLNLTQVALKIF